MSSAYAWSDYLKSLNDTQSTAADKLTLADKGRLAFGNIQYMLGLAKTRPTLPASSTTSTNAETDTNGSNTDTDPDSDAT